MTNQFVNGGTFVTLAELPQSDKEAHGPDDDREAAEKCLLLLGRRLSQSNSIRMPYSNVEG